MCVDSGMFLCKPVVPVGLYAKYPSTGSASGNAVKGSSPTWSGDKGGKSLNEHIAGIYWAPFNGAIAASLPNANMSLAHLMAFGGGP